MEIRLATEQDAPDWDCYVKQHELGTFFHLFGWNRVIDKSFNHPCFYVLAMDEQQICGILPLVEVKSLLFGHALVSTPFCVYGGVIADSQQIQKQLEQFACQLAEKLQVDYLELRYKEAQESSLLLKQAHTTFGWTIPDNNDDILAKVKKKQRAVIRHAFKNNLSAEYHSDIDCFYQIMSQSYRNLGTPIFSKKYFQNLMAEFADDVDVLVIKDEDNRPATAVMNFYFNEQVLPYYGGGNADSRKVKAADFMYYQVMCDAVKKGYTWFDFGRSKNDSGPFKYKKNWGMDAQPLHYYYHLVKAKELPNLSPNNPKYKLFIAMWQKFPLLISQKVGPFLSKSLG